MKSTIENVQQIMFQLKEEDMRALVSAFVPVNPLELVSRIHGDTRMINNRKMDSKNGDGTARAMAMEFIDKLRKELNLFVVIENVACELDRYDQSQIAKQESKDNG